MTKAKWTNGKQIITGYWCYTWHSDKFTVELDSKDPITGLQRRFSFYNDTPEWDDWKLIRD